MKKSIRTGANLSYAGCGDRTHLSRIMSSVLSTRELNLQMGILGVEPRLSPYKEPALTIKLYSRIDRSIAEDLELYVKNLLRGRCVFVSHRRPR